MNQLGQMVSEYVDQNTRHLDRLECRIDSIARETRVTFAEHQNKIEECLKTFEKRIARLEKK